MIDPRTTTWKPDLADLAFIVVGGLVEHKLVGVLAFDKGYTLGDQALQFDRFHLKVRKSMPRG